MIITRLLGLRLSRGYLSRTEIVLCSTRLVGANLYVTRYLDYVRARICHIGDSLELKLVFHRLAWPHFSHIPADRAYERSSRRVTSQGGVCFQPR